MAVFTDLGQEATTIAEAISLLPSTGGKIFIGAAPSTDPIEVSSGIELADNIHIQGAGMDITYLQATASMTGVFQSLGGVDNVIIEDLTIDVNSQASTSAIQLINGASSNITLRNVRFVNTVGAWQVHIGYAAGTSGSPGSQASNLLNRSENINIENCIFDTHTTTTLEQCILVNTINSRVRNCTFRNNTTITSGLIIYAFCNRVLVDGCTFEDTTYGGVIIQQSEGVEVVNSFFSDDGTNYNKFVNVVNSNHIRVDNNIVLGQGSAGDGSTFVALYDFSGATFESGNYTSLHQNSGNVTVNSNLIDGVYQCFNAPNQTDAGKSFGQTYLRFTNNNVLDLEGLMVNIGHTTNDGITNIEVTGNTLRSFKGDDLGAIYVTGTATTDVTTIVIKDNQIPVSTQGGSNAYGIYVNYANGVIITGNNVVGKGSRKAIHVDNSDNVIIRDNDTNDTGIYFSTVTGSIENNLGCSPVDEYVTVRMTNTDGDAMVAGDIVILKSVAAGNEITHTNTGGDTKVFGQVVESIANTASGSVLVKGKSTTLKVNGTTDIAVGDYLSTFTSEGIAQKASAGQISNCIALEAYTTDDSSGVIDALFITPRQI